MFSLRIFCISIFIGNKKLELLARFSEFSDFHNSFALDFGMWFLKLFLCEYIAAFWPASKFMFWPIVESTNIEASQRTYARVTGSRGRGPINPGLLNMRDVNADEELNESSKNMPKNGRGLA